MDLGGESERPLAAVAPGAARKGRDRIVAVDNTVQTPVDSDHVNSSFLSLCSALMISRRRLPIASVVRELPTPATVR